MTTITTPSQPSRLAELLRGITRVTAPITRQLAGRRFFPLWAVLRHRGRLSGHEYAIPVAVRVTPEAFVIGLPWGDRTQWVRNVIAAGGCTIRWRGTDQPTDDPELIGLTEASGAFTPTQRAVLKAAGVTRFMRLQRATAKD